MKATVTGFAVCLTLISLSGCNLTSKSSLNTEPLEGELQFSLSESYQNYSQPSKPDIFLSLQTKKIYGCYNYQVIHSINVNGAAISVNILGVALPGNICLTALGPAKAQTKLNLPNGDYHITLRSNDFSNDYTVSVTDSLIQIDKRSYSKTEPLYHLYWRHPEKSFVYACGTLTQDSTICTDFIDTLKSKITLREFTFPGSGEIPYPTASDGHYYDMPARFFYYQNEEDFDKIESILKDYKEKYLKDKTGYGISVTNWMNKSFYSWLL